MCNLGCNSIVDNFGLAGCRHLLKCIWFKNHALVLSINNLAIVQKKGKSKTKQTLAASCRSHLSVLCKNPSIKCKANWIRNCKSIKFNLIKSIALVCGSVCASWVESGSKWRYKVLQETTKHCLLYESDRRSAIRCPKLDTINYGDWGLVTQTTEWTVAATRVLKRLELFSGLLCVSFSVLAACPTDQKAIKASLVDVLSETLKRVLHRSTLPLSVSLWSYHQRVLSSAFSALSTL